ncbi:MAG: glycosyltransferase family 9 protein [Planctomycetes bacterium]|nr:glycosyltransferase family 9 protein [Planctomycetota bacterium]
MSAHERIVLVRLSHLGDVLHALPVYHALARHFPGARLAWVIQREYAELVRPLARLERVIPFDRRGGARAWLEMREALGAFAPTRVIDAQGNTKSAVAALVAGSGERVGLAWTDWRERLGAFAMHARAKPADGAHAVERMLALARQACGAPVAANFDLELSAAELALGRELAARFVGDAREPIVLALADAADVRAWPTEHVRELARELVARERAVLVLSGPSERSVGERVERELGTHPRLRHWVGQRGLRELAATFTALAERGGRFVGCDSGPMHLAWVTGLTTVCLAGPQDPRRTGPWPLPEPTAGPGSEVTTASNSSGIAPSAHVALFARERPNCAPCFARTCEHELGNVCMRRLAVADVLAALG